MAPLSVLAPVTEVSLNLYATTSFSVALSDTLWTDQSAGYLRRLAIHVRNPLIGHLPVTHLHHHHVEITSYGYRGGYVPRPGTLRS